MALSIGLFNDSFPPQIDGVATVVVNYGKYLTEHGYSALVATPYAPKADDTIYNFPVVRFPSLNTTQLIGYRAGMPFDAKSMQQLKAAHFELLHSHCPFASQILARSIRSQLHIPLVMTYHTKYDVDIANAVKSTLLQESALKLLISNIEAADEVWTVSKGAGENLRANGYQGDYIVMPNGVDFPLGRVDESVIQNTTGKFSFPEGVPVFLYLGRMMWYKGIRISLDALAKVKKAGYDFRMVFVGGGTDKEEITAYTKQLGLSDRVYFDAPVYAREKVRTWYCRADLFLFPSTFDTNGLVVREAAACALPSILVKGSCAAEDAEDGVSAFLIEENADSMAEMLVRLLRSPEIIRRAGKGAQEQLYLSWNDAVTHAEHRYEKVLENYSAGVYKEKEKPDDSFFKGIADVIDIENQIVRSTQQSIDQVEEFILKATKETAWQKRFEDYFADADWHLPLQILIQEIRRKTQSDAQARRALMKLRSKLDDGDETLEENAKRFFMY